MIETLEETKKKIEEYSKPHEVLTSVGARESPSLYQTRIMVLRQQQAKYNRRKRKIFYLDSFYLDLENYRAPNFLERILHYTGLHHWLYYEDDHCYDTRVCMICGISQWTIYPRELGCYKMNPYEFPNLEKLKKFLEELQ
jgi:hypothetical protein